MLISLHKNATTTPATRLALQQASGTDRELAQQYGIGIGTDLFVKNVRNHPGPDN